MNQSTVTQKQLSACEWGKIAREAASKAIACNRPGEYQFWSRYHQTAKHAAKMELLMTRRSQLDALKRAVSSGGKAI